ncbi:MAG TPA: hypothetical protein PLT66_09025, partial [Bacillota bacterium]|nr:hypothetical protein [Bacillota bacterium]
MSKRKTTITALVLTALLLVTLLASCDSNNVSETSGTASTVSSSNSGSDTSKYVADIPNVNYNGDDFNVYTFYYERGAAGYTLFGSTGDSELEENAVNTAILERNYFVEEQLGININELIIADVNRTANGDAYTTANNLMLSGTETIHLLVPSLYSAAAYSQNGQLVDLLDLEYLHDLSAPWWDSYFVNDAQINGKLDFVTGDMTLYAKNGLFVNLFNKELFARYELEDPYQLVRDNEWTLDKVSEMAHKMSSDQDNNGVIDYKDSYGFGGQDDTMTFWFYSFGGRIVSKNADGGLELTLYSEKNVDYIEAIRSFMLDHTCYISANDYWNEPGYITTPTELLYKAFMDNRSLFFNADLVFLKDIGDMKTDFGILPQPLYDENQENYMQALNCWNTNPVCIPSYL